MKGTFLSGILVFLLAITAGPAPAGQGRNPGNGTSVIQGAVRDPSGMPLRAVFVQARNLETGIGITVLTDTQGFYYIDGLTAGRYALLLDREIDDLAKREARGVRIALEGQALGNGEIRERDFSLELRPVRWTELSTRQYRELLPDNENKGITLMACASCHGFRWQSLFPRNDIAWGDTVDWIVNAFSYHFDRGPYKGLVTSGVRDRIAAYMASVFGPDAGLPDYPPVQRGKLSDRALDIVFVDYPMPTIRSFPWAAVEDPNGRIWIPHYATNRFARLDPDTGEIEEFRLPGRQRAALQSAVPAADGSVWLAAPAINKLIRFQPDTGEFSFYQPAENDRFRIGQFPHGLVLDAKGRVWAAGGNLVTRFDPDTEAFDFYGQAPLEWDSYSLRADRSDTVWFARTNHHRYGRIDAGTGEWEEWDSPTPAGGTRQIAVDSAGNPWFGEWNSNEIFRRDAGTGEIRRYPIPGDFSKPDAIGVDEQDQIWYYSWGQSELGRLDPETGEVVLYPVPYIDTTMRTFNRDKKGRIWFGAPPANRAGYFYLRSR